MPTIFLSLGSNIGDRKKFLLNAINSMKTKVDITAVSSFYLTEPWGNENQNSFINICVKGDTQLPAEELLRFIKSIESTLGRTAGEKWGPREIDIDILFYGRETISSGGLEVPHPHLAERAFVLVPLSEIAPDFVHPSLKKSVGELVELIDKTGVKRLDDDKI